MLHPFFYTDLEKFGSRMNDLGKRRVPFLFCVDYGLTEAFVGEYPSGCRDICFASGGFVHPAGPWKQHPGEMTFEVEPVGFDEYSAKFGVIHRGLKRGDSFLANLTVKTPIRTNLSLEEIFHRSKAPYKICVPGKFVCFSPERFVKISGGKISSNPMKGTISASVPCAEREILSDFKEKAEHSTIVDLIRNDLSMVAENVRVERFRYIDRIRTSREDEILQVSSEIIGTLPENHGERLGDILLRLLPAGSICGAPKKATVELIRSAERENRGYYTGVFGCFDGETLDSAVMIRFIEEENGRKYFRSGGGITAYSRCGDEYDEVLKKIYLPFV